MVLSAPVLEDKEEKNPDVLGGGGGGGGMGAQEIGG